MKDILREKAEEIVSKVKVARMNETAYLTVEDLKKEIAKALREAVAAERKRCADIADNFYCCCAAPCDCGETTEAIRNLIIKPEILKEEGGK